MGTRAITYKPRTIKKPQRVKFINTALTVYSTPWLHKAKKTMHSYRAHIKNAI